jgi:uncharacterized protein (DUF433 family)
MNWKDRISVDSGICHGEICIEGAWIRKTVILDNLAVGEPVEAILRSHPTLKAQDIQTALWYAIVLASDLVVAVPVGA